MTGPPGHLKLETTDHHTTKALVVLNTIKGLGWVVRIFDICDRHGWLAGLGSFLSNLTV